jgi:hypothetical protein
LQQLVSVVEACCQRIEAENDLLQLRSFLPECLRAIRLIPDVGLFQFPLDFSQAFSISVIVKDTPLTPKCVR